MLGERVPLWENCHPAVESQVVCMRVSFHDV